MIQQFLANRRAPWSVTAALLVSFMVFAPAESQAEAYIGGSIGQSYIELECGHASSTGRVRRGRFRLESHDRLRVRLRP